MDEQNNYNRQPAPVYDAQLTEKKHYSPMAIVSMCLGIASLTICCATLLGIILGIVALVLGLISMRNDPPENKGFALAGVICGSIGCLLGLVGFISCIACYGCIDFIDVLDIIDDIF